MTMGSSVLLTTPMTTANRQRVQDGHIGIYREDAQQQVVESNGAPPLEAADDVSARKAKRRAQSQASPVVTRTDGVSLNNNNNNTSKLAQSVHAPTCAGCHTIIRERYLLRALEQLWHEDCLKCACCDCRLGEVGSTLFTKDNLILCKRDYLRLFGTTGLCSACNKSIPACEMVMRARGNVYHLECFACQQCNHRFCVGDRFYVKENRILCEDDMFPQYFAAV